MESTSLRDFRREGYNEYNYYSDTEEVDFTGYTIVVLIFSIFYEFNVAF